MWVFEIMYNTIKQNDVMKTNNGQKVANGYRIESVKVSTNGRKELYFDVKWSGKPLDYYELRVFDKERNCLECLAYAMHEQRVVIMDHCTELESKKVNSEIFHVELGVAEYSESQELVKWDVLAAYEPIKLDIYYEWHMLRKNVMEIR